MKIKRTKSFVASIFGILANLGQLAVNALLAFALFLIVLVALGIGEGSTEAPAWTTSILAIFVLVAFAVLAIINLVSIILSIVSLTFVNGSTEKFNRKKKVIIATIVFGFITTVADIAVAILGGAESWETILIVVLYALSAFVLILVNVLYIVDLKQEKKRALTENSTIAQASETSSEVVEVQKTETIEESVIENVDANENAEKEKRED